jgi:hypothetical protein
MHWICKGPEAGKHLSLGRLHVDRYHRALQIMERSVDLHLIAVGNCERLSMSSLLFRKICLAAVRGETIGEGPSDEALGFQYPFCME